MKKPAEIYRFWNDTQTLTLIIEDKDVTLPEPPIDPPVDPPIDELNTPTGIELSTYNK